MVTSRTHTRLVRAGDALTAVGHWVVVVVVIVVASALAAAASTIGLLTVLDLVAGGGR